MALRGGGGCACRRASPTVAAVALSSEREIAETQRTQSREGLPRACWHLVAPNRQARSALRPLCLCAPSLALFSSRRVTSIASFEILTCEVRVVVVGGVEVAAQVCTDGAHERASLLLAHVLHASAIFEQGRERD